MHARKNMCVLKMKKYVKIYREIKIIISAICGGQGEKEKVTQTLARLDK